MRFVALSLVAASLLAEETPIPVTEQRLTGFVEAGYRWRTEPGGSLNTYRSVVDLGSGPKLLKTQFSFVDPKNRFFDRAEVRAFNWGDDPYSTLHVSLQKQHIYDFNADYRNLAYFNYLPLFADRLLSRGTILNERSFDIRRRMSNVTLELLPGNWITPFIGWERSSGYGRGINTFVSDVNEYPVPTLVRDAQSMYRGGVRIQLPRLNLTVEQGGTTFRDDQSLYENVRNTGNRDTPFLGPTLTLNSLLQAYGIRSSGVHTRLSGTGSPVRWLNLSGDFLYSRPTVESRFQQANTGTFVVSSEALAFTAQQFLLTAQASMPRTTGTLGVELLSFRRTRVVLSYMTDRLDNNGSAASQNALIAASALPLRSTTLSSYLRNDYSHAAADVIFDATAKLSLRAGYRYVWGEGQTAVLPAQGLVGAEIGRLQRNVASGGFSFRPLSRLTFNADVEGAASARSYFRTSLNDYQRGGIRTRFQVTKDLFATADTRILNNQNPTPGINFDLSSHRSSASLQWSPNGGKRFSVQADYSRASLRSDTTYLIPQTLQRDRSLYREYSHNAGAVVDVVLPVRAALAPRLSIGGTLFRSGGTRPTTYYQPTGSLSVPLNRKIAWISSWRYYGFGERPYIIESFRTHLIETGIRFSR